MPASRVLLALVLILGVVVAPGTAATAGNSSSVGLVDTTTGFWYLRDPSGGSTGFYYGNPGDVPFMGDWDCDGVDTPGLYRRADGFAYLRNSNSQGVADVSYFFGNPGDVPMAGDFDGDGCDTVSLFRPSEGMVYVVNRLGSGNAGLGSADVAYPFGSGTGQPVAGDFDGDGFDEVGSYDGISGVMSYLTGHGTGTTVSFGFGNPGDRVVAGDWTGTGTDDAAVFRPGNATFYFAGSGGSISYGNGGLAPVAGYFGPLPGTGPAPPTLPTAALATGSSGPAVGQLQQLLAAKAFYRGPIDGNYGERTMQAVMAFHKDQGLPREWSWAPEDWARLAHYAGPALAWWANEPFRVEINLGKQVGYLVENHRVTAIFPVASGNGALFTGRGGSLARAVTPRGDFRILRHIDGLRISYLGVLYKPWYFKGGYALHGSPNVPAYPASHGCIRMPNWEADWMDGHLFVGMPMHVY